MIKKVCFLVNYNQYETKRYFTQRLAEALRRHGVETDIIDVHENKIDASLIDKIVAAKPDFTASFNSFIPFPDNTYLWDFTEIPHLSMLLDPSLYSVSLIRSPYSVIACVDQSDCYGLSTQNFDKIIFMPHAVERDLFDLADQQKEFDIVFLGSCYDYETLRSSWKRQLSALERTVIEEATNIFLSQTEIPLQEAFVAAWGNNGASTKEVDFLNLFSILDHYTRGIDRVELIRHIQNATVHLFGELFEDDKGIGKGWKSLLKDQSNIVFHEPVDYGESLKILQRSKICLNSSPFFKFGAHERIFAGFACGALVVTNDNPFLRQNFQADKEIIFYNSNGWSGIETKIQAYLENEEARRNAVLAGREKVKNAHTWDQRAKMLQDVMPEMIKKCNEQQGQQTH